MCTNVWGPLRGALREINVDTLVSTRPPLTWSPSRIWKGETWIFLWKPHTYSAEIEPGTYAWLARQAVYPLHHVPFCTNRPIDWIYVVSCIFLLFVSLITWYLSRVSIFQFHHVFLRLVSLLVSIVTWYSVSCRHFSASSVDDRRCNWFHLKPSSHQALSHFWFNVGPTPVAPAQH